MATATKKPKRKRGSQANQPALQWGGGAGVLPMAGQNYIDQTLEPFRAVNRSGAMATQGPAPLPQPMTQEAWRQRQIEKGGMPAALPMPQGAIDLLDTAYGMNNRYMAQGAGVDAMGATSRDPRDSPAMWRMMATNRAANEAANAAQSQADMEARSQRAFAATGIMPGSQKTLAAAVELLMPGGREKWAPQENLPRESGDPVRTLNLTTEGRSALRGMGLETQAQKGAALLADADAKQAQSAQDQRIQDRMAGLPSPGDVARRAGLEKKRQKQEEGIRIRAFGRQGIPPEQAKLLMATMDAKDSGAKLTPQQELMLYGTETAMWLANRELAERGQVEQESSGQSLRESQEAADALAQSEFEWNQTMEPQRLRAQALAGGQDPRLVNPALEGKTLPLTGDPELDASIASLPPPAQDEVRQAVRLKDMDALLDLERITGRDLSVAKRKIPISINEFLWHYEIPGSISPRRRERWLERREGRSFP